MKSERLQILHDFIESIPAAQFDMGVTIEMTQAEMRCGGALHCGTVACLAGWSAIIASDPDYVLRRGEVAWKPSWWSKLLGTGTVTRSVRNGDAVIETARRWLGLTKGQANALFYGDWPEGEPIDQSGEVQQRMALSRLKQLIIKAKRSEVRRSTREAAAVGK